MSTSWTIVTSPVGALRISTDGRAVIAVEFEPHGPATGRRDDDQPVLCAAAAQMQEYFAGQRREFDLPLAPRGTEFQRRVWQALRAIPYGQTATYGQVASRIGLNPATTSRAVGRANGSNPLPVLVPCHRVIGANGTLTGFAGGLPRKQWLLDLEAARLF